MVKVDTDVPIPEKKRTTSVSGVTVEKMKAGDSVYFTDAKEADTLRAAGMKRGYRMSRRKVDGGWRVWVLETKSKRTVKPIIAPPVVAAPVIPLLPPKRAEPGDMPAMDDARVTELHALCIAYGCRATILHAREWVSEGVSAEQLRSALNRIPRPASVTALDSILHESEAA